MAYLIVRLKLTTIEKVVSLVNKLEKYDIVESVELHNDSRPTPRALDAARRCPACKALLEDRSVYCDVCGTDTPRQ